MKHHKQTPETRAKIGGSVDASKWRRRARDKSNDMQSAVSPANLAGASCPRSFIPELARSALVLPITRTGMQEASPGTEGKKVPINSSDMEFAMWAFLSLFVGFICLAFGSFYLLLVSQL